MRPIKVPVPPLPEQQRFVAAIEQLEQTIAAARAVMQKYL
jgi:restriction endonuclease S subunit